MSKRLASVQEITNIYHAMVEASSLQGYYLQSLALVLGADCHALFLLDESKNLQPVASEGFQVGDMPKLLGIAQGVQASGKPFRHQKWLSIPVACQGAPLGAVCLQARKSGGFSDEDQAIAVTLSTDFISALKNIQSREQSDDNARRIAAAMALRCLYLIQTIRERMRDALAQAEKAGAQPGQESIKPAVRSFYEVDAMLDEFTAEMRSLQPSDLK